MTTLLITGTTGQLGGIFLEHALASPSIEHIISLQRRPGTVSHPKLTTLVLPTDAAWTDYPASATELLSTVDAVVWFLTAPITFAESPQLDRVATEYTTYALKRIAALRSRGGPLRCIYASSDAVVRDQEKWLMFASVYRKARGRTEEALVRLAGESIQVRVVRLGIVTGPQRSWIVNALLARAFASISRDEMCRGLMALVAGAGRGDTVENGELVELGTA